MTPRLTLSASLAAALVLAACSPASEPAAAPEAAASGEVNVYSARHYDVDQRIYEMFTATTGIKVNKIEGSAPQLIARMQSEGAASPADVFVAADAGALWRAQEAGLLAPVSSEVLNAAIPENLREPEGRWFGFQRRVRVVAYDPAKVRPEEVATYEAIASPRFRGKLCVRSSDNIYNLSLVGGLLEAWGPEKTADWAKGIVANLARQPEGGDRDQIRAVGAGVCEIALTNSYYYIRMAEGGEESDRAITEKVKLAYPSLDGQGVHVNVSGGGVTANAPNREAAIKFLEFLASPQAQTLVSQENGEFPATPGLAVPAPTNAYTEFTAHPMSVATYGPRQNEAQTLMTAAGWR
ncbi:MAG: extracellular solute-binding protein [Phenylobacterium sp.]|uniref:extracellular solute-binding protein n=1 Tax=Phenylobacterium sp. TaxID=1871053 RepID=UPI0025F2C019|nr:extracellular solute-binding protein [Phenylobacterium sp.]MCG9915129.1 extracellular solute-binding protein [Phenylobacterium sp.]